MTVSYSDEPDQQLNDSTMVLQRKGMGLIMENRLFLLFRTDYTIIPLIKHLLSKANLSSTKHAVLQERPFSLSSPTGNMAANPCCGGLR